MSRGLEFRKLKEIGVSKSEFGEFGAQETDIF